MSEVEYEARLGRAVRQHADAKKRVKESAERIAALSARLSGLAGALRVSPDGSMPDESKAHLIIHELPDELCADFLRGVIAEYKEARGKFLDAKSQLEGYGVE